MHVFLIDFHIMHDRMGMELLPLLWQCDKMASIDEFRSILAKWDKVFVACGLLFVACMHALVGRVLYCEVCAA